VSIQTDGEKKGRFGGVVWNESGKKRKDKKE